MIINLLYPGWLIKSIRILGTLVFNSSKCCISGDIDIDRGKVQSKH